MPTRSEIRQLFAAAIKDSLPQLHVFAGRHIDYLHDVLPATIVSFDSVAVEQDMADQYRYSGTITAIVVSATPDDDDLDGLIDAIIPAVQDRIRTMVPGMGCQLIEIAYNREFDPGVAAGVVTWQVDYGD
jgi:hypothetical protein